MVDSVIETAQRTRDGAQAVIDRLAAREEDQPLPRVTEGPCIQDLVTADIVARKEFGRRRYGTVLQPFNGRDSLRDAYEEALDLAIYLRQLLYEREHPQ